MSYNTHMRLSVLDHKWAGYVVAVLSVFGLTLILKVVDGHINAATVSLALLLNVLFIATRWGSLPALLASILAMLWEPGDHRGSTRIHSREVVATRASQPKLPNAERLAAV